jgi:hypothetical protein
VSAAWPELYQHTSLKQLQQAIQFFAKAQSSGLNLVGHMHPSILEVSQALATI